MHQALAPARKKPRRQPSKHAAGNRVAGEPLVLETVAPEGVEALNIFFRRRSPVEVIVAGEAMALAALWPRPEVKSPRCVVAFTVGGAGGELDMPRALVERWLIQADPDVERANLKPEHAALLLESFFDGELAWLEGRLGCQVAVTAIGNRNPVSDTAPYVFSLRSKQDDIVCTLHLADTGRAAQLWRLLDRGKRSTPALPLDLPVPVSLLRGAVTVGVGDIQSLAPGDVVLLDDIENEAAPALMMIGGRFVAPVEFTSEGACLMARLCPVTGSKWEWIMDNAKNPDAARALEDSDLEDLPVTLVFELGRTALPLGELKQLAPGAIVPLPEVTKETVDVVANGKRVGRGEIVRIGESLGVRVVRMFDNA